MNDYELEKEPFYMSEDTNVKLFRGVSLARNRLRVVVKKHDFYPFTYPDILQCINRNLNSALSQAKVQHPNSCDILELRLEFDRYCCAVHHILEALDSDVENDIEERRKSNKHYTETELREFLHQISSALEAAHSKGIAHRDIKPKSIFRTGDT